MDMNALNFTSLEQKVFSLLCLRAGEKFSQREIAKFLKVSPTAISNSMKKLKDYELIRVEKAKTIHFVSLNRAQKAIELKRVENLKNIYLSGLSHYLENEFPGGTIVLFGSYSRGEDISTSDIDFAVVERRDKLLELEGYERLLRRRININFYKSWKEINAHLRNNILNGIVLHGSVEL